MLSNRRTSLVTLDGWQFLSRTYCEKRIWWPNRLAYLGLPPSPVEMLINVTRRAVEKHFASSYTALKDVVEAEKASKIIQGYTRLANPDNTFITQETAQNVWRKLQHVPPIPGRFGPYWWHDENFNPMEPVNPIDMNCPI